MSGRARNRNNRNKNQGVRENAFSIAADNPILPVFLQAARKLTERHDRHERLVKLSRDITIESKRIIFLLHSVVTVDKSQEDIMSEAKERLDNLVNGPFKTIAIELDTIPAHLHSRATTAGMQEFVEARTLFSLMENKRIITLSEIQDELTFTVKIDNHDDKIVTTLVPPQDYMLGLSDLTGELMRKAINSISGGDSEDCFFACQVVRQLYAGFLGLFRPSTVLTAKLATTRANVQKIEYAVYALRVRGGEIPAPMLLPAAPQVWEQPPASETEGDEGFY